MCNAVALDIFHRGAELPSISRAVEKDNVLAGEIAGALPSAISASTKSRRGRQAAPALRLDATTWLVSESIAL